jgi:hypothetical protein
MDAKHIVNNPSSTSLCLPYHAIQNMFILHRLVRDHMTETCVCSMIIYEVQKGAHYSGRSITIYLGNSNNYPMTKNLLDFP